MLANDANRTFLSVAAAILLLGTGIGAQDKGVLRISLQDAQARAGAGNVAEFAKLGVDAARYHRKAAQADYFPKVGATFVNLHYNKFMGERIPLFDRTVSIPLLRKDETIAAVTVTQPVTSLFKVRQGVEIARADERVAQAKAESLATEVAAEVEQTYFELLIAQRQLVVAQCRLKILEGPPEIVSVAAPPAGMTPERHTALLEATEALFVASSQAARLSQSLNVMMGLAHETELELAPPAPFVETVPVAEVVQHAIAYSPEVVEADQTVAKARAATTLSKLEYVPDVAVLGGYAYQNAIPLLPDDFSFIGVIATFNVFDFGKRELTLHERQTQLRLAEANAGMVRAKVANGVRKAALDVQRTRRILELRRNLASTRNVAVASSQEINLEDRAAWAKAEADMFQADLDYRSAYAALKQVIGGK